MNSNPTSGVAGGCRPGRASGLIALLGVTAVVAIALSACAMVTPDSRTLFERIGGEPVITAVVADTIDELAQSPDGRRSFEKVKLDRVKKHVVEQFCALTGGPCVYSGDDMRLSHGGLEITEREFNAIVDILRQALARHGVGEREKNELLRLLAPMKRDIVTAGLPVTRRFAGARMRHDIAVGLLLSAAWLFASANAGAFEVNVVDQNGQPVADAVVFARGKDSVTAPAPRTAIIDQIDKTFVPRVSVLATGTTVSFPNKDNIKHHVYSFSPPKVFQLKLYHGLTADPVLFDKPGLVVLGCNIHDGMIAYVYIVDAPYFALTDAGGRVELASIPPGDYELQAWHYQMSDESTAVPPAPLHVDGGTPTQTLMLSLRQDLPLPPPLE